VPGSVEAESGSGGHSSGVATTAGGSAGESGSETGRWTLWMNQRKSCWTWNFF